MNDSFRWDPTWKRGSTWSSMLLQTMLWWVLELLFCVGSAPQELPRAEKNPTSNIIFYVKYDFFIPGMVCKPMYCENIFPDKSPFPSPFPDTLCLPFQYKKYDEDVKKIRQRIFGIVNYINTVRADKWQWNPGVCIVFLVKMIESHWNPNYLIFFVYWKPWKSK